MNHKSLTTTKAGLKHQIITKFLSTTKKKKNYASVPNKSRLAIRIPNSFLFFINMMFRPACAHLNRYPSFALSYQITLSTKTRTYRKKPPNAFIMMLNPLHMNPQFSIQVHFIHVNNQY